MHIAPSPVLLSKGEPLFAGHDLKALGYEVSEYVPSVGEGGAFGDQEGGMSGASLLFLTLPDPVRCADHPRPCGERTGLLSKPGEGESVGDS
jgi:hypothetical protein